MPQVSKYDIAGKQVGEMELNDSIFNEKINEHLVHTVIKAQLAAMRMGTASTKTRGEVKGGGRKPWRQKGTGRARQGSIRAPQWVGGGTVFGPTPRKYYQKVNRKVKKYALRSILTDKLQNESLIILDKVEFDKPKTKQFVDILNKLNLENKKVLFIMPEKDKNLYLSARNIPKVKTLVVDALNAYDLLNNESIIIMSDALQKIEEVLAR